MLSHHYLLTGYTRSEAGCTCYGAEEKAWDSGAWGLAEKRSRDLRAVTALTSSCTHL